MLTRDGKRLITAEEKRAHALASAYWQGVDRIAADARQRFVIPFCDKYRFSFVAGMGGWGFYAPDGEPIDKSRIPKRIAHALTLNLENRANDLGSIMADYKPA